MAGVTVSLSLTFSSSNSNPIAAFSSTSSAGISAGKRLLPLCRSKKKLTLADQILDYIEGGPKLRRWYGAPDLLPKDGSIGEDDDGEDDDEASEERDAILVSDGDSEIGQMVILSLIVKRFRIKALVGDKRAALEAFGTYVEPMAGDLSDKSFLKKAMKGVRTLICPNEGFLCSAESLRGVQHVIILSQLSVYKGSGGIVGFIKGNAIKKAEQQESAVLSSGIPYTIIRAGSLQNSPGGDQGFSFEKGCSARGRLSKEDAAFICVEAIDAVPQTGLTFEVVNGEENISDWKDCLVRLMDKTTH